MVHSFVMIETAPGDTESVLDSVAALAGVEEAHVVAGDYDVVVEVEGEDVQESIRTVSTDIRELEGVDDTRTYIALE
ncbi:ArsR family transcriptional regulator [Halobacteriales archaeon QH_6_64_20]|nr:MAG: ArsR family transcriptional regulator [Halobacteriales archaeon QH_6_64_20]